MKKSHSNHVCVSVLVLSRPDFDFDPDPGPGPFLFPVPSLFRPVSAPFPFYSSRFHPTVVCLITSRAPSSFVHHILVQCGTPLFTIVGQRVRPSRISQPKIDPDSAPARQPLPSCTVSGNVTEAYLDEVQLQSRDAAEA